MDMKSCPEAITVVAEAVPVMAEAIDADAKVYDDAPVAAVCDAAPADAAPPPPSPADVILQRAQRNSRGVDREAEAAEQRWASLGGGSALGDGTNEAAAPAPPSSTD